MVGSCECRNRSASWIFVDVVYGGEEALTEAQKDTLSKIGYDPENPYAKRDCRIDFRDVYPEGYVYHPIVEDSGSQEELSKASFVMALPCAEPA